ncbi:MAG: hypothetical protein Q4C12_07830 [Clostridia bacterium]|nr:hypothetical protein [Clostridia bacterium]
MSDKESFWDNPFGGLFDFDGDGKEDLDEQFIAYMIFEEVTKKNNNDTSSADFDLLDNDLHLNSHTAPDTSWRDYCEDGLEYGVDAEDYETEEEYEEALDEAKSAEETEADLRSQAIPLHISVDVPALDKLEAIKEADYKNKRRYNAAYTLANEFLIYGNDEYEKKEKACCNFIIEKADEILAADYLSHSSGFLFAQAIKDNFKLPISLPDEDEERELGFSKIICKIAKRDIALSFKVWAWCLEQFLPYVSYDKYSASEMSDSVIDELYNYPKNYRTALVKYMDANPDFCQKIMGAFNGVPSGLPQLITAAIEEQLFRTAQALFKSGLEKANGKWKEINQFTKNTLLNCKNYDELESIEYFKEQMLPLVKAIDIGMVQDEIEDWEKEIAEYIDRVESDCEQYAYTRKNAWRKTVPDAEKYDLDPCDYDTEQEYLDALNEAKYGWRKWYSNRDNCGLDPNTFETQEAFTGALNARREEKRRKEREERQEQENIIDPAILNDKTIYTYCGVALPVSSRPYHYITGDTTIKIGDKVIVPVGDKEAEGTVISVGQYARMAVPFPVERTKRIKCVIRNA